MYTLYGSKGAGSAAIEMALRAANMRYQIVQAATWEPASALDELRKVNPLQQIPTLVFADGTVMTESAAILIHLGLEAAPGTLLPVSAAARAQAIRGLVFIAANCYSAISIIDYPQRWTSDEAPTACEALRAGSRKQLHRNWEIFADTFNASPFLSGEAPGALDFMAGVVSRWSGTRQHLREHRPALYETLQRIEAHPLAAPVFREHWEA